MHKSLTGWHLSAIAALPSISWCTDNVPTGVHIDLPWQVECATAAPIEGSRLRNHGIVSIRFRTIAATGDNSAFALSSLNISERVITFKSNRRSLSQQWANIAAIDSESLHVNGDPVRLSIQIHSTKEKVPIGIVELPCWRQIQEAVKSYNVDVAVSGPPEMDIPLSTPNDLKRLETQIERQGTLNNNQ